jgi:tetratricopeptide (TPR) repeat protein
MTRNKTALLVLITLAGIAISWLIPWARGVITDLRYDVTRVQPEDFGPFPPLAEGIRTFQERVERDPRDAVSLTILGGLYLQQARQTGDASNYLRAETALRHAIDLAPNYFSAKAALAEALYSQHDFLNALQLAEELYAGYPTRFEVLAIIGDANLALGRYPEAQAAYEELAAHGENAPLLARLAQLSELEGDPEAAVDQTRRAAQEILTLQGSAEDMAWYLVRLSDLLFKSGRLAQAEAHALAALRIWPQSPAVLSEVARIRAAQGEIPEAIELYEQSVARLPLPETLAALGDLYTLTGQEEEADLRYDTVGLIGDLAAINGQIYNRQLARFYLDHDRNLDVALRLALAELETRQDVFGYDTAAWAYYKNGMLPQAQEMMERALSLGTRDAVLFYHAGLISLSLDRPADAEMYLKEALSVNPYFSPLQTPHAREVLEELEGKAF